MRVTSLAAFAGFFTAACGWLCSLIAFRSGAGGAFFLRGAGREKKGAGDQGEGEEACHKGVGWKRFMYSAETLRSAAYLLTCTGAGGGGGVGLEAQETRPPAMTEAARARRAYFIVCVCICYSSVNYNCAVEL